MIRLIITSLLFLNQIPSFSQTSSPILDRWLYPNPGLPRNASSPLFQDSLSLRSFQVHQVKALKNQINQPLSAQYEFDLRSATEYSLELWMLNHVNEPIGLEIFLDEKSVFGIWGKNLVSGTEKTPIAPWKSYWNHVVAIFSNGEASIFMNGQLLKSGISAPNSSSIFIQSYLNQEPYLSLDHWIKHLVIHDGILNSEQIQVRLKEHQQVRDRGLRFPNSLHFLAEPYLFPTDDGMRITFETDRKVIATVFFGDHLPLKESLPASEISGQISSLLLPNLSPGKAYFYQVLAKDEQGNQLDSGILTFKTKPTGEVPIVFGVVSDTEARPQINEQIGLKLWDERPDFVIHMGDVTDGGKEKDKWQWTQEYFPGSAALTTRIPMIPTAGNGEGDLFWYKRYHPQAQPDGFFDYRYGAGAFFVLNSNRKDQLQPGGIQYNWLEKSLMESPSTWKFVYLHHAPYSADEDDYGDTWKGESTHGDRELLPLVRLLEKHGVDVLFFGHLHTYMRSFPLRDDKIDLDSGIHFVQVGGMGGNLEDFAPNRVWFSEKTFRGFHYGIVSLTQERFTMNVYQINGALIDRLEITK